MNPLLSIIIPTKDRYSTLIPVLNGLVKILGSNDIEFIIQDNTKINNEIELLLININCEKIKYFHSIAKLSMTENCNLAIGHSTGHYLTMIGDDDLVSPYIFDIISIMQEKKIDCIFYTPGNYYWPGVKFNKPSYLRKESSLQISKKISSAIKEFNTSEVLDGHINSGAFGLGNLPRFYHGIVSRSNMNKVKEKFGSYIPGSSPDMAISTALALCIKKHHYINYPVTITGVSVSSAAGLGAKGAHIARIEDVPFLPKEILHSWDPNIPRIWTGPTIYAQTAYEVLSSIKDFRIINYLKMYEYMYVFLPNTRDKLIPFIQKELNISNIKKVVFFSISVLYWFLRKFLNLYFDFFKAKVVGIKQFKNVNNINECIYLLESIGSPLKY